MLNEAKRILQLERRFVDYLRSRRLAHILATRLPFRCDKAEAHFEELQNSYPARPEYGYDLVSLWKRAANRCSVLVDLPGIQKPGKEIIDIGTGDGVLGTLLETFGHQPTLADQEDWRHERAHGLPFVLADVCKKLPLEDNRFDLVCSYNAFEHFHEPAIAYKEIVRVCKPGGWIYIEFGPLYASPWGLHAYRALRMPYPQFLFSASFISQKLQDIGISDLGRERTALQYLNRWTPSQFCSLWRSEAVEVVRNVQLPDRAGLSLIGKYPHSFQGRGLSLEDVTVATVCLVARKRAYA